MFEVDAEVKRAVKARLDTFEDAAQTQSYIIVRKEWDELVFEVHRFAHNSHEWSWSADCQGEHLVLASKRFQIARRGEST